MTYPRCLLLLVLVAPLVSARATAAYCDDANDDNDSPYLTMDSKCTVVSYDSAGTHISARVKGPQTDHSPFGQTCAKGFAGISNPAVTCRRVCGDLPNGKTAGTPMNAGFGPPSAYTSIDLFEVFSHNGHATVCARVRNWTSEAPNQGKALTFAFTVPYK
jgi:hypothetical protein